MFFISTVHKHTIMKKPKSLKRKRIVEEENPYNHNDYAKFFKGITNKHLDGKRNVHDVVLFNPLTIPSQLDIVTNHIEIPNALFIGKESMTFKTIINKALHRVKNLDHMDMFEHINSVDDFMELEIVLDNGINIPIAPHLLSFYNTIYKGTKM